MFQVDFPAHLQQTGGDSITLNSTLGSSSIRAQPGRLQFSMQSSPSAVVYALAVQVVAAYLSHVFGKFACKIKIQVFSYSLPLSLAGPTTVCLATFLAQLRAADPCSLHGLLPDYLALLPLAGSVAELGQRCLDLALWLWPLWWLAQVWTCLHIWQPHNDKNAPTEKLFVCPWYCGLLVDQCSMMNRRIVDWSEEYLAIKVSVKFMLMNYCNQAPAWHQSSRQVPIYSGDFSTYSAAEWWQVGPRSHY